MASDVRSSAASRDPSPSPRHRSFVGRREELATLSAQLAAVLGGSRRVVVVEGPSGTGKTTLVRHWLATRPEVAVRWAGADEAETALPYGVLAQLIPGAGRPGPGLPPADPLAVGAQLLESLAGLTAAGPLALVVDDAHWADPPSLAALSFALRRLRDDPVLAVFCARDDDPVLPEGICRMADESNGRLRVGGLSAVDLIDLARAHGWEAMSRRAAERLREHTGGSPLHAGMLLDELEPASLVRGDGPLPVPRSFSLLVLHRLAATSPDAQALVEATAVLGRRAPLRRAVALAGIGDPGQAIEEAVAADLLAPVEQAVEPVLAFSHPLVWAAVYRDLGTGRRAVLHGRAAELFDGPEALDHRVAAVLVEDPDLAFEVAARAAEEDAAGARRAAAAHLVAAARLASDPALRERWRLDAVERLLVAGDVSEAADLARSAALPESSRRSFLLGWLALLRGDQAEAERELLVAWEGAGSGDDGDPGLAGRVALLLANLTSSQMRTGEAAVWSRRALDSGSDELVAAAVAVLVPCLGATGKAADALHLVNSLPDRAVAGAGVTARLGRGMVRMWTDDVDGAVEDLSAVVEACQRNPASQVGLLALGFLAEAEFRRGDWDASLVHGDLVVSLATDAGQAGLEAFAHAAAAWAAAARGEPGGGQDHAAEAVAAARRVGDAASMTCAVTASAHVAFCRGDHAALVTAVEPLLDAVGDHPLEEPAVHPWPEQYAAALVTVGRLDDAERVVSALESSAAEVRRTSALAHAARVRGRLQAARGDSAGAERSFQAAVERAESLPSPFDRALAEDAYGRFLRREGERRAAAARLRVALDIFTTLGAEPFAERCRRELAACGVTRAPAASAGSGPGEQSLTPQEVAVCRLVAEGLTNREVAAELVVSVKTVEFHLGRVFTKLGVRSRSQLAAHVARHGPRPAPLEPKD